MNHALLTPFEMLDHVNFVSLCVFAFGFRIFRNCVEHESGKLFCFFAASLPMGVYFIARFFQFREDPTQVVVCLVRAIVAFEVGYSGLMSVISVRLAILTWRYQKYLEALDREREIQDRQPAEPEAPQTEHTILKIVLPRPQRLKSGGDRIRADYKEELKLLEGLPLDEEEREILAQRAKQRLLERIDKLSEEE